MQYIRLERYYDSEPQESAGRLLLLPAGDVSIGDAREGTVRTVGVVQPGLKPTQLAPPAVERAMAVMLASPVS